MRRKCLSELEEANVLISDIKLLFSNLNNHEFDLLKLGYEALINLRYETSIHKEQSKPKYNYSDLSLVLHKGK